MDHIFLAHGIAKDAKYPTTLTKQAKAARLHHTVHHSDAGLSEARFQADMSEARFQAICTTRYIIRRMLPFSHVECPAFLATVHAAWKIIES